MKKVFAVLLVISLFVSCSSDDKNALFVNGTIRGLKKGTLYLQKIQDSVLTNVDSLIIKGSGDFAFKTSLESPEVYYLYLNKEDHNDINDRITFFGEPGSTITINTTWNTFDAAAKIEGSELHKKYEAFKEIMSKFNTEELVIVQALNDPKIAVDSVAIDSLQKLSERNGIRGFRYALNYAFSNSDSYLAPYVVLTEVPNTSVKYLDSVNNALSDEVANSTYGKALQSYIEQVRKTTN